MLAEFAPLYAAGAARGISAAALDEMELWQVGAALGLTTDEQQGDGQTSTSDPLSLLPPEYLEERARAIAEGRPLPDPPLIMPKGRPPSTADLFSHPEVPQVGSN